MLDLGWEALKFGRWTLDVGRRTLDVRTLYVGRWTFTEEVGRWTSNVGRRTLTLEVGRWRTCGH